MLFSSLTFIFIFLPLTLGIYYLSKEKYRNYILLVVSLLFYSWGEPKYIMLMILSILFNYYFAILVDKYKKEKSKSKSILIISLIFNIGLLFLFKYLDFVIINFNNLFNLKIQLLNLNLPIGISFYTFQILSYVVDVYKKDVKVQKNIFDLGTYISFFPQLIAGPIVRYSTIEKQLKKRKTDFDTFCSGIRRFIFGVGKKIIIANNVAVIADAIFNSSLLYDYGLLIILFGTLAYTLQIYFDFSGYSDMAIGLGKMFGFDFLENFNYPYSSISITDFWRRWHISLSSWFRDYVYIPLGGNRVSKYKFIRNICVVWFLTGLWHGASWNYILWGIYYAVILLFEKLFLLKYLEKIPKFFRWLYSIILINIGWVIFRIESIRSLKVIFSNILRFKDSKVYLFLSENYDLLNKVPFVIIGIVFSFPVVRYFDNKYQDNFIYNLIKDIGLILILILSVFFLINDSYNPFIYFRF